MPVIDDRGRIFGRLNLFDAAVAGFVIVLIPIAYGTFLLFRSPTPSVTSVAPVEITKEERRVGGPGLRAKLKVHGSGLRPMLRASIDDTPAIGFVFENPNSADVLVGSVPPGAHDLVLYDGVQEVARAAAAVTVQARPSPRLRMVGTLLGLDEAAAAALQAGGRFPAGSDPQTEIVNLGPVRPEHRRLAVGASEVDVPYEGRWARRAVVTVRCDPDPYSDDCTIGGKALAVTPLPVVVISGPSAPMSFAVDEVLPDALPRVADVRVRLAGSAELLDGVTRGDRDAFLDDRAATVVDLKRRPSPGGASTLDVVLRLGADAFLDGWRYRGRELKPGATFTLSTDRYVATGSILTIALTRETRDTAGQP